MASRDVGSVLSWWGGKGSMAIRIKSIFPNHKKYVEVFGGGAHILYQKDQSEEEVYNDIHEGLISVWRVLQNPEYEKQLKRSLELTPVSREEFDHCRDTWRDEKDPVERARKFYVTVNQSFSSGLKNWKAMKGGKGVAKNVSKFYATINNRYDYVHKRLQNILIESMDYKDLIKKHDGVTEEDRNKARKILENKERYSEDEINEANDVMNRRDASEVLFYIDPPYIGETRTLQKGYDHEMTDLTLHEELVDLLLNVRGNAVLSGYDHWVYDRLIDNGWDKITLGEYAKSSAYNEVGGKKTIGTEVLWVNYDIMSKKNVREGDVS